MARCIQCPERLDAGVRVCPQCRALQPITVKRGPVGPGATVELGYGRIVVQARLGEGGMGSVYRAWLFHAPDGPRGAEPPLPLALKVLHARAADTPQVRALFADEAEALKSLRHPNIVRFHDFFDWGGPLALAMELVEGNNLEEVIARNRARAQLAGRRGSPAIAPARAWYYFQQLLGALAATHALGIVHRDVKPSNVLVRSDGIVKLGDFGIARLVRGRATEPAAPSAHALGTGAYMSPEQVLAGRVDARSDLYSAAIVFYEMLAGRPPFLPDERSEFLLRQDQIESAPPPLGVFAPDAPKALEPLLAKALAKDAKYRFATALDLGEAIRQALGERDTTEWTAQREIARNAPLPARPEERDARAARLTTLHDEVIAGYQSASGLQTGR